MSNNIVNFPGQNRICVGVSVKVNYYNTGGITLQGNLCFGFFETEAEAKKWYEKLKSEIRRIKQVDRISFEQQFGKTYEYHPGFDTVTLLPCHGKQVSEVVIDKDSLEFYRENILPAGDPASTVNKIPAMLFTNICKTIASAQDWKNISNLKMN